MKIESAIIVCILSETRINGLSLRSGIRNGNRKIKKKRTSFESFGISNEFFLLLLLFGALFRKAAHIVRVK